MYGQDIEFVLFVGAIVLLLLALVGLCEWMGMR